MGHERVVRAIAGFEEERHAGDQTKHGTLRMGVGEPDGDEKGAGDDGEEVDEVFLPPDIALLVDEVGDHPAHRSEDNVEEAEHGGPVAGAGLAELGKVLDVIGAEDGVDGQFRTKGAEITASGNHGLEGEDDSHCFLERGLDDDLATSSFEHGLLANLGFVVKGTGGFACSIID